MRSKTKNVNGQYSRYTSKTCVLDWYYPLDSVWFLSRVTRWLDKYIFEKNFCQFHINSSHFLLLSWKELNFAYEMHLLIYIDWIKLPVVKSNQKKFRSSYTRSGHWSTFGILVPGWKLCHGQNKTHVMDPGFCRPFSIAKKSAFANLVCMLTLITVHFPTSVEHPCIPTHWNDQK